LTDVALFVNLNRYFSIVRYVKRYSRKYITAGQTFKMSKQTYNRLVIY